MPASVVTATPLVTGRQPGRSWSHCRTCDPKHNCSVGMRRRNQCSGDACNCFARRAVTALRLFVLTLRVVKRNAPSCIPRLGLFLIRFGPLTVTHHLLMTSLMSERE